LTALLKAFHKYGYRLTVFHVISPDIGSTLSVGRWLEMTGDQVDHVAVINLKHGKPDGDFPYWYGFTAAKGGSKGGKVRERFLAKEARKSFFPRCIVARLRSSTRKTSDSPWRMTLAF